MTLSEIVEITRDPNVFLTVLDDLVDFAEAPPFERLHSVRDFALTEGRRNDTVELGSEAQAFLEVEHQIQGWELLEIFLGVGPEDLIVKTADVVADDQAGVEKEVHELRDRFLVDDQKLLEIIAVCDTNRDSEPVELAAAANLGEGALSFEIEDDDLFTRLHFALGVRFKEVHLAVPILQDFLLCFIRAGECSTAHPSTHPGSRYRGGEVRLVPCTLNPASCIPVQPGCELRWRADRGAHVYSPAMMTTVEPESNSPPVELTVFSGPLDLLLHLIRKNEVSIYDIPIVSICDQYNAHLRAMQELDLDVAGDFLWMASWLLHLKSKMLLPSVGESEEDPRDELVERLLAYRGVKELASYLHDSDIVRRCLWTPDVETKISSPAEPELDWEDVDLRLLAQTYLEVMQRFEASHPPPIRVLPLRFKVEEKMTDIYERVNTDGLMPLLRHLNSRSDPEEVVTVIVAALELVRLRGVFAEQRKAFAEIYLRPGDRQLSKKELLHHGENSG